MTNLEMGASYTTNSGNIDKSNIKASARLEYYEVGYANVLKFNYEYGEQNGVKNIDSLTLHLRHIHNLWDKVDGELFAQYQQNEFKNMDSKYLTGANLRYKLESGKLDAFVGLGMFYTWLDEVGIESDYISLNSYIALSYKLSESTSLSYNGYFQPRIEDFDDYLIYQEAQLKINLTDRLSLLVNILHEYDAMPPSGVEKSDFSQTTGFSYSF
ncbi:MAG: DUF481 domain-containing protein [Campylobacterales bacterium]|nr:DUF481 domain-containing protein [Campylobacterales bacterium]